jgi:membrane-associated HD superfamily phosphohydrolase
MTDSSSDALGQTDQDVTSEPSTEIEQGAGSLADAVNAALGEKEPEATPASDEPGSKEPVPEATDGDELSEEEKRHYSERTQRRFHELVEARRSVEGERDQIRTELDAIKPKAERMDHLLGYMQANSVTPEHLDNALGLTALINKGEYDKAIPYLEALLGQVRAAAGDVLPKDLADQVERGAITEANAKELQKARLALQRTSEREQQSQHEREQRDLQTTVNTAASTADAWHKEQAASDPDWNLKRDLITQRVENELGKRLREQGPAGYPRTTADVRAMLDRAKKDVEQTVSRFRPAPKAINPPVTGGSASPRSRAKPGSLMDAVNAALERSE